MKYSLFIISFIILSLSMASCAKNKGEFTLTNKANETIVDVLVEICGAEIEFSNIKSGETVIGSYEINSDCHYDIRVKFLSGRIVEKKVGYVTNGLSFRHNILLTNSDVNIMGNNIK